MKAVLVGAVQWGAVRVGATISPFFSSPDHFFCFCFSKFRGISWNFGGLCAFLSLKVSSQHTFGVLWTSCAEEDCTS